MNVEPIIIAQLLLMQNVAQEPVKPDERKLLYAAQQQEHIISTSHRKEKKRTMHQKRPRTNFK